MTLSWLPNKGKAVYSRSLIMLPGRVIFILSDTLFQFSRRATADKKDVQGDVIKYFHTANRYRTVLVSPDTRKIYVATDNFGNVMDETNHPTHDHSNPGSILVFEYTGQ